LDEIDRKLLAFIKKGIDLTKEPFSEVAQHLGITQKEVIVRLTKLKEVGVIRKFGASIKPNQVGFSANALVAWKVPADRIQNVGSQLSKLSDISHCYEREIINGRWEYNLYTVMHAKERQSIQRMVDQISFDLSLNEYKILYSKRDLKRIITNNKSSDIIQTEISEDSSQNLTRMENI